MWCVFYGRDYIGVQSIDCSFQNCYCACSHDSSLLHNQPCVLICHWEGSHWCPLYAIKLAVFWIPIMSPCCNFCISGCCWPMFHHHSTLSPLVINILFWWALPPPNWPQSSAKVKNEWSYTSFPPCAFMVWSGMTLHFHFCTFLSSQKSYGFYNTTKTFSVPWKIYVFLHNWQ
jgi:hypothetical protein